MKIFTSILMILLMTALMTPPAFAEYRIPDTGQTKCYDDKGKEINPCPKPGEPFYGQDGNYSINPMSFTKLDSRGKDLPDSAKTWAMVRDNNTGLIWEVKTDDGSVHDKDNKYTWEEAKNKFIKQLNKEKFGGFSDWRLPAREELRSIVNYGKYKPTIDTSYFPNTIWLSFYWASETPEWRSDCAWGVEFYYSGRVSFDAKSESWAVRAVRDGQSRSFDYLVINGDGTVTDKRTNLMWQQGEELGKMTWKNALKYCENLNLAGYDDWRLPTIKELASLLQLDRYNPALDKKYFPDVHSKYYWTSTSKSWISGAARGVLFYSGHDGDTGKSESWNVRAVRGGQARQFDHLVISQPKPEPVKIKPEPKIEVEPEPVPIPIEPVVKKDKYIPTSHSSPPTSRLKNWYSQQYALVIGINDYKNMSDTQDNEYAVNDAKAIAAMFRKMGFHVRELYDQQATRDNIINEIRRIKKKANPNDSFVFYFAGHGQGIKLQQSDRREGYILPYDADIDLSKPQDVIRHDEEGISLSRLRTYTEDIGVRHTLLMLDSCFSGLVLSKYRAIPPAVMNPEYYSRILSYRAINILTAGDVQNVLDGFGHSPFTKWVLKALDEARADLHDNDGYITFTQFADYVKEKVKKETGNNQRPQSDNLITDDGEFLFRVK